MSGLASPLTSLTQRWQLSDLAEVARTPRAIVYRARRADGSHAALKLMPNGPGNETNAPLFLRHFNGRGMVRLLEASSDALLLEWLDGQSLGDLARAGQDDEAMRILAQCARCLANIADAPPMGLTPLSTYFRSLATFDTAPLPSLQSQLMRGAQQLLTDLLQSQPRAIALHGDLHHENLRLSKRGWVAFDPKALIGDPHYEPANAFRHPAGCETLIIQPARVARMADIFSTTLGLDRERVLQWAAVKCALSSAWAFGRSSSADQDLARLGVLMKAANYPLPRGGGGLT